MPTDPILIALQRQVGCYQRLAKLAETQHDHVQKGRTEELLTVLGQRQQVLDQLAEFERTILPAKRRWSDYLAEIPQDQRAEAERLMTEVRRLLEEITAADRNDSLILQQRKHTIGRELGQNAAAKNVTRTYAAAAYAKRPTTMDIQR